MARTRTSDPSAGTQSRHPTPFGRPGRAFAAVVVVVLGVIALAAVLLARTSEQAPPPPSSTTTTTSAPSTTVPVRPVRSTPALYPGYLPAGVAQGSLVVDGWSPPTFGGYVQSYYGTKVRGQSLPELVIGGPEAEQMFATSGQVPEPTVLGGYPVRLWRIVSAEQAVVSGGATVTGLTATVAGRVVSLIGVSLSDAELGSVLRGLRPRTSGTGWVTDALPASLVRVAQGDRSEDPSFLPYRVQFSGDLELSVSHDVVIPRGACVCNAESWPVELTTVGPARAVLLDTLPAGDQTRQVRQIEWQYSADADVTLTFAGISTREALRIAASVHAAPRALWASLSCSKNVPGAGQAACDPEQEIPTAP